MARRSGLGKGLGALIPTELPGQPTSALREVPIGNIRPNTRQPRTYFDEEAMSSLAASIRELGVLQPVLVKEIEDEPDSYELIAGERRWRAARRAGLQTIPVLAQTSAGDAQSLEQALVENLHREDLNPLEEAAAYQQLIDDFSFTHEQVAKRVGKSRAAVTNTLRLLQLPAGVQRALADSTISAGHARALLGTPDRALQEALVARIIAEGLTVRAVEDEIRSSQEAPQQPGRSEPGSTNGTTSRRGGRPRRLPEPGLLELEELLAAFLNTRVKVDLKNRKGRLVIEFATLEDLERIYRTMVGNSSS
jgi:ParB family chromosome partitioning protein